MQYHERPVEVHDVAVGLLKFCFSYVSSWKRKIVALIFTHNTFSSSALDILVCLKARVNAKWIIGPDVSGSLCG